MKYIFFTLFGLVLNGCVLFAQEIYYTNQGIPRDSSFTAEGSYKKYSKYYPEIEVVKAHLPQGVAKDTDVVYTVLNDTINNKRRMYLDIFYPKKKGKYPALIMVHGGGWRSGDKSLQIPMAMQIAKSGFVTVAVEYQLTREAKYPNAVYNIKSAIRWMRANAEKYGIDTSKIAISGCSAGGQLAVLTGLTSGLAHFEGDHGNTGNSSNVQAIIDMDGVLNFLDPQSLNLNRKPDSPDIEWLGGSFSEVPETWQEASGIYWVNENSPPILFLTSGYSRFTAGKYETMGLYNELGIYSEWHKFDVKVHPFWLFHPYFEPTVSYTVNFLNKIFQTAH